MMQNSGQVYEKVYKLINPEGNKLLDVGAGTGDFIRNLPIGYKPHACGYEKIKDLKFKHVDLNKDKLPYNKKHI